MIRQLHEIQLECAHRGSGWQELSSSGKHQYISRRRFCFGSQYSAPLALIAPYLQHCSLHTFSRQGTSRRYIHRLKVASFTTRHRFPKYLGFSICKRRDFMSSLLSFPSNLTLPMRSGHDKEMAGIDLDQLFEDCVETDFLQQISDFTADQSSSDDLGQFFELPTSSSDSNLFGPPAILDRVAASAWHQTLEQGKENPISSPSHGSSSFCPGAKGISSVIVSDRPSLDNFFELEHNQLRSTSQPSTPRPQATRTIKKAVSFHERSAPKGIKKLSKKSSVPALPKMMHPSYYRQHVSDVWPRKMQPPAEGFQLSEKHEALHSPPLSSGIVQNDTAAGFFPQDYQCHISGRSPLDSDEPHTPGIDFGNYQLTPQASPAVGISQGTFTDNLVMAYSSSASSTALSALHTPPSSLRLPMTMWGPDTSPNLDYDFAASSEFVTKPSIGWWNEEMPGTTQPPAGGPIYRKSNARSSSSSQNLGLATTEMSGLGISCDSTAFGDFSGVELGVSLPEDVQVCGSASFDVDAYSSLYQPRPPPQQQLVNIGIRPLSRSPSPTPQPRFHRRRPSGQSHHSRASHSSQGSRRKSSNTSQHSSRQSSSGNVGFVNFTPDDSRKILTGVAPSGSSKTKARREKEAAEKRRKLSQAAVKAVMEAGGDMDSLKRLEREGLLSLDS